MKRKERAFFICFVISAGLVSLLLLDVAHRWVAKWWPWFGELLNKGGGVGLIATFVMGLNVWVVLFLVVRWFQTARERGLTEFATSQVPELRGLPDLHRHITR